MAYTDNDFAADIDRVRKITLISTLLDVVCQTTGMGFAAVARVTQDRWIACCVRDSIQFGLVPGGELQVETTICREIRDNHQAVIIDHVQESDIFRQHPTPLMYGFESYISFPIFLKTGEFFGTLCAIDPNPAQIDNPRVIGLFTLLTDLISFHLQQIELLEQSQNLSNHLEQQVQERTRELQESVANLQRSNTDLEQFAYIASHDLQEPLRKIHQFGDLLKTRYAEKNSEELTYLERMQSAAARMSVLIKDLLNFSRITTQRETSKPVALDEVVNEVLSDLELLLAETQARVEVGSLPVVEGNAGQLGQLFQNLLSNALKFRRSQAVSYIQIKSGQVSSDQLPAGVNPARVAQSYYQIEVIDNGIGFDDKYVDRIFQVFQRLHSKSEFAGTGIGLAICEKVVNNHGGTITARSQVNQGATFTIYLPV